MDESIRPRESAPPPGEETFYVTYGHGSHLQNCYSTVHAPSIEIARGKIFGVTHGMHAFIYAPRDWLTDDGTQATKFNLRLVPLQPQRPVTKYNRAYV